MIKNDWITKWDEISTEIAKLKNENAALKKEATELRAERDYWRQIVEQPGGRG